MSDHRIDPADESRHPAGAEPLWNESYYFDFHDRAGNFGGYVRVGLYPNLGVTWYWACVVGAGRPLVTLSEHAAAVPDAPSLGRGGSDFAARNRCESPLESFRVSLDGEAKRFDDPGDVYDRTDGESVPLALDLVWDTVGSHGYAFTQLTRYEIPCDVRGEIRVGDERIEFTGHGQRDHSWGVRDWWTTAWCWNAGRLDDGTRFHSVSPRTLDGQDVPFAAGYVVPAGGELAPIASSLSREELLANGFPRSGRIEVGDLHLDVTPRHFSPVLLTAPDGRLSRFPRCLAEFVDGAGRRGFGWIEWNQPQQSS